eukprot:XP_011452989.1 PREDICTED: uncharacterized protein LOC105346190 [Crassostrea gigas]
MLNSSYLKNLMDDMEIFMRKSLMQLPLGVLRTGQVKIMKHYCICFLCLKNGEPRTRPLENTEAYGVQDVKNLSERFKNTLHNAGVDREKLLEEWQVLKCLIYRRFKNFRASIWEDIHAVFGDSGVTNILKLLDLIHRLPPTSVLNETGFNQMKLIKTDRRQSLSARHLNDLMLIRLQSPSIAEFDPNPAIDRWMISPTGQKRRFHYRRIKKPITNETGTVQIDSESEEERERFRQRMRVREKVKVREKVMKELKTIEWMKIVTQNVSKMLMRMKQW